LSSAKLSSPLTVCAVCCACALVCSSMAHAELIIDSPCYVYEVDEFFTTHDPNPALTYGVPILNGNVLKFDQNLQFSCLSSGENDKDTADGKLAVMINAKPGCEIDHVSVFELGGWSFDGAGTNATEAKVEILSATVDILEIDGLPVLLWPPVFGTMKFDTPPPDEFNSKSLNMVDHPGPGTWAGTMTIDLAASLIGTQYEGHKITKAQLVIDNKLATWSEIGSIAFIDKKRVWIGADPIPEPATLLLLGIAATVGLGVWCRRK
jgi:hypothetical protein